MQQEIWKDIPGTDGFYQISNLGRVRSFKGHHGVKVRIMKPNLARGYKCVMIRKKDGFKYLSIHRLVAMAFIPNPDKLPQVNHKNEIKTDNRVENLEWCTHRYNNTYGTARKRGAEKKRKKILCIETGIVYKSGGDASKSMNIEYSRIMKCCNGKAIQTKGYHFKFA